MSNLLSYTLSVQVLLLLCTGAILRAIHQLSKEARKTMAALDDVTSSVHQNTTVVGSAIALLTQLKAKLDAAIAATPTDDSSALEALSAELGTSTSTLAAAVAANTVADPAHVANTGGATSSAVAPTVTVPVVPAPGVPPAPEAVPPPATT